MTWIPAGVGHLSLLTSKIALRLMKPLNPVFVTLFPLLLSFHLSGLKNSTYLSSCCPCISLETVLLAPKILLNWPGELLGLDPVSPLELT